MASSTTPSTLDHPDAFLDQTVTFPNGERFERLRPLTDLRKDPGEARILYTCRQVLENGNNTAVEHDNNSNEFVMKIKAQWPGPQNLIYTGPSPHTLAEIAALRKFRDAGLPNVPHLISWKKDVQGPDGIHPGGYVVYMVITKMPGLNLFDLGYWSLSKDGRGEVQRAFMRKLNQVRALGIAPYDCALRNVLWDKEGRVCSIVDFEHYREIDGSSLVVGEEDEIAELQNWGLAQRPPPGTWHVEWARGH